MSSAELVTVVAVCLLVLDISAGVAQVPSALEQQPGTLKERLSDKSSDEQRVDNCKVPIDRRGARPRPEGCSRVGATAAQPK